MYELTPIYGNHIGMVISNQDPESRNRIQVFIPYLSNTLFEGWNKNGEGEDQARDISLTQGDLSPLYNKNILQRLEKMLPWAEMAYPLFGANGSAYTNPSNGNILPAGETINAPINIAQNSASVDKESITDGSKGNNIPQPDPGSNLNNFTEEQILNYRAGKDITNSLSDEQQEVLNQLTSQGLTKEDAVNQMMKDTGNFYNIKQDQYDDNGQLHLNSNQQNNLNRIKNLYGVDEKTAIAMMSTGAPSPQNLNANRSTSSISSSESVTGKQGWQRVYDISKSLGDPYPEVTASQWALESGWGKHMSGTNNPFGQTATNSQDGTVRSTKQYNPKTGTMYETTQKFRNYNSLEESIQDHLRIWKPKYESASNAGEALNKIHSAGYANYNHTYTGEVTSIMNRMGYGVSGERSPLATAFSQDAYAQRPSAPTGPNISSTSPLAPMDMRESNGMISVPPPGTMVWVFFVGGDPNRPVYFAGVTETNAGGRMAPGSSYIPGNSLGVNRGLQGTQGDNVNTPTADGDLGDVALNSLNGPLHRGQNRDGVHCYAGVKTALLQAGAISNYSDLGSTYALDAMKDLSNNPNFERIYVSNPSEIPYNAVSVWGNGYPGHIDIKAKDKDGNAVYVSDIARTRPPNYPLQAVFVRKQT